ncbi:NAD(P)(+)--arginine ADP-ribosyltransferase 1-like [Sphaeramia orbicularis]|uniref:NAD(P)(+)--arginine ADP-ribosyltransferase n=1 Tax=Sphaeramia orbicularis TaxID=375764 RepID=A0A673CAZ6_9TELE|nr:NAD(P)(+)--arginine ADP-ribosyltransferase 1-like [Sphaeramia orbicularis]
MKDNVLIFTCLGLLLHWVLPVTSTKIIFHPREAKPTTQNIPLDMAGKSVDDMYFSCFQKMTNTVEKKFFQNEMKDRNFASVWNKTENCANNNIKKKQDVDKALNKNHMQAICLYTDGGKEKFYSTFNEAVRTGGSTYTTSFHYHSFHFWLTSAIQILRANQQKCHPTYRRTNLKFKGKVNERIRFGYFASSSFNKNMTHFGKETCFCINTCYGADLKKYPKFGEMEKEVLIPPYEIFKVTKKNSRECLPECKVRYTLESAGVLSYQNCKAVGT